jgi:protein tyrosine phosphatase (PTP) superfamily phosphohydrolase (DUF442 family)
MCCAVACIATLCAYGAGRERSEAHATTTQPAFAPVGDPALLPNAHVVTARVIAGAQPEGDEAFRLLRDLGVKTIVSVDGAKPDVAAARKYGLTYVHLPITYAGVTPAEGREIAKALDELPGLVYLHCHHGQHRAAAAVAVACVFNGSLPPDRAESVLQTFGTAPGYKGLWQAARDARPLPPGELEHLKVDFVATKAISPLADAMVQVDERADALKLAQNTYWSAPSAHPDLDPAHEALQLEELLREIGRAAGVARSADPDFTKRLAESEDSVRSLRTALEARPLSAADADAALKRVTGTCTACHAAFRN